MDQNYSSLMWSNAVEMLTRAERLHRQFFRPARSVAHQSAWEPPIDVLETDADVVIVVALPGVIAERVEAVIEGSDLLIAGIRTLPAILQTAIIHRLELPQGRFERRVPLPSGRYSAVRRTVVDGCLMITLHKAGSIHG